MNIYLQVWGMKTARGDLKVAKSTGCPTISGLRGSCSWPLLHSTSPDGSGVMQKVERSNPS